MATRQKNNNKRKTIFLVPHTHYDVAWAMTKQDYLNIHKKILRQALEMIRNSEFRFLIEQTFLLEQIQSSDPDLFSEIKSAIQAGKIEIADGEYLMPDPMIPAEEVLVREILFGKLYSKETFGVDVPVAWMADGFGLNAQLPQIYRKSGYKWLAFRRGLPRSIGSRMSEFIWEGLDGSRIPAHWMPLGYRAGLDLTKWKESHAKLDKLAATQNVLMPCGSGGMLIQEEIPDAVEEWNRSNRRPRMVLSTPSQFFEALDEAGGPSTVFKGELYSADMEDIFPDVVSSRISLKLAIRECEDWLKSLEKASALAFLRGQRYPRTRLTDAWKKMLFLGFHDIVPSCGIDEIYDEAWEYIGDIKKLASEMGSSLGTILPDHEHGVGVMVFNPHSWSVTDWVEVPLRLGTGWSKEPGVYQNGKELVSEARDIERWDDDSIQRVRLGFVATVPPLGYRVYEVRPKSKDFRSKKVRVKDNHISTRFFDLRVDEKTGILSVRDKDGHEILKGNEVVIDAEVGDLYFHKSYLKQSIGSESGDGIKFGVFKPEELKIEKGPIRTTITYKSSFYCLRWPYYITDKFEPLLYRQKTIDVEKRVVVYNDIPRIDFFTELDSQQPNIRVRLRFDTCMAAPVFTRETQFGAIELPPSRTREEGVKMPSLTWLAAEEADRGLSFLSKGVPINEVRGGEIFCTLLRSVSVLSADGVSGPLIPTPGAMELGKHSYQYSVFPYQGTWKSAGIPREAACFGEGIVAFQADRLPNPREYETFRLAPDNLLVTALKKAERDETLILRFFEAHGQPCRAQLNLPKDVEGAVLTDLLERPVEDDDRIEIEGSTLEMDVNAFEIVTLQLTLSRPPGNGNNNG